MYVLLSMSSDSTLRNETSLEHLEMVFSLEKENLPNTMDGVK